MSSNNNGEAGRTDEATENAVMQGIRQISQGDRLGASNGGYNDDEERQQPGDGRDTADSQYQLDRAASLARQEMSTSQSRKMSMSTISAGISKLSQLQQQKKEETTKMDDLKKDLEMVRHVIIIKKSIIKIIMIRYFHHNNFNVSQLEVTDVTIFFLCCCSQKVSCTSVYYFNFSFISCTAWVFI